MKKLFNIIFLILTVVLLSSAFASCKADDGGDDSAPASIPIKKDSTEAKTYFTVSFDTDGAGEIQSQTIEKGKNAVKPANLEKTGYTFSAWYNGDSVFDFSTPITANITLKAKWTANTYTVTLNNNGTETQITATYGEKLPDLETIPTVTGRAFGGYYTEASAKGTKYIDAEGKGSHAWSIARDTTLYAAYGYRIYYYNLKDVENPNPDIYISGDSLVLLDLERITGYAFKGWYDSGYNNRITSIEAGAQGSKSLYAKWEEVKYTVQFETDGQISVGPVTVTEGNTVAKPNTPYDWFTSDDGGVNLSDTPFDFNTKIFADLTLYVRYGVYADASDVVEKIKAMTRSDTVYVSGPIALNKISEIREAIVTKNFGIGLDLSKCEGLAGIGVSERNYIGYGFLNCTNLSSITLPNCITYIGNSAFKGCNKLETVTIPGGVTSIGASAFENCNKLESINIPGGVNFIEKETFKDCTSLTHVSIANGVKQIWESAFINCTKLTDVTLPDSIGLIKVSAFEGCSALEHIKLSDAIWSIESSAFKDCTSLPSITLPIYIENIWDYAFQNCTSLRTVTTPEGCKYAYHIHPYAFKGCVSLTGITIPDGWNKLTWQSDINEYAFDGCTSLTTVDFGNATRSIGKFAFNGCTALTSIVIPDSCKTIGESAFKGCDKISEFTLGNGVTTVSPYTFSGCTGLTSINLPSGVTSIGDGAFSECSGLTNINLPSEMTSIGAYTFSGCIGLTNINLPSGVTSIGNYAFSGCSGLTRMSLPNGVTSIGEYAFNACSGLTSITLSSGLTSIGEYAFNACSGLTSITFPSGLTSIGAFAFYDCSGIRNITFRGTVAQWNAISKLWWRGSFPATKVYCSDGTVNL